MDGNIAHTLEGHQRTDDVKLKEISPFSKMQLSASVRRGLEASGFTYPTIIQAAAIPIGKSGLDLLVQSKSGTGKTVIFCTIILEAYKKEIRAPQSLIVAPTREIAVQIDSVLNKIGQFCVDFHAVCVIGGLNVLDDRKHLQSAKAIVGTPGRLLHLMQSNVLNTSHIKLLVLDEADRMFSPSFRKDLINIQKNLPSQRQTIACSATFCDDLDKELAKIMLKPLMISTENRSMLLLGIKQFVCELPEQKTSILEMQKKLDALRDIFARIAFRQCLIFAGSQSRADSYRNYLEKEGWECDLITGAQDQKTRLEVFNRFREFKTKILIATDLMSRGIDSEYVNLVINLELPTDIVTYLHRIGRAGRFGSHGIAVSFVASAKDQRTFKRLINQVGGDMDVLRLPKIGEKSEARDFWDFANPEMDCEHYGLFGKEQLAPLASLENVSLTNTQDTKETEEQIKCNSNSSIDTKTFQVDSKESAFNAPVSLAVEHILTPLQKLTPESCQSSTQQLPTSNTIDDASSITADSLCSSQQDIPSNESLIEVLLDITNVNEEIRKKNVEHEIKNAGQNEGIDKTEKAAKTREQVCIFDEYFKTVNKDSSSTSQTPSAFDNNNKTCIQSEANPPNAPKYANNEIRTSASESSSDNDTDKDTFILSVASPPNVERFIEELPQTSSIDLSQSCSNTESLPEVKHFPSPAHNYHNSCVQPDVVPVQNLPMQPKLHNLSVNVGVQLEIAPYHAPVLNVAANEVEEHSSSDSEISAHEPQMLQSDSGNEDGAGGGIGSSGFDEKTTSVSSGIDTSEAEPIENGYYHTSTADEESENDNESAGEGSDGDVEETEEAEEEHNVAISEDCSLQGNSEQKQEYETSDEEEDIDIEPVTSTTANEKLTKKATKNNHTSSNSYQNSPNSEAAVFWNNLYNRQTRYVREYVKFVKRSMALSQSDDFSD